MIQSRLVQDGLAPASTLAFVGSLVPACIAFFAIINAKVIRVFGARNTGFIGVTLLGLGSIFAGWATESVVGLFITAGLISGIGTSLCFMVSTCSESGIPGTMLIKLFRHARPYPLNGSLQSVV